MTLFPDTAPFVLHQGDCIEGMQQLADRSVDHVIADPEYSDHVHRNFGAEDRCDSSDSRGDIGFRPLSEESALAYARGYVRVAKRWVILFCDEISVGTWKRAIVAAGGEYIRKGTWVKLSPMPQMSGDRPAQGTEEIVIAHAPRTSGRLRWNGGGKTAVYHFASERGKRVHPTQKPEALMRAIVQDFTDPQDLILDSHAGSGTTGLTALELGRRFIGFERDPQHYANALARLTAARRQEQLFSQPMQQLKLGGAA